MDILEKEVEKYLVQYAHKYDILTYKLVSPGQSGVPDRILILSDGSVHFVELKAPGKKPRPLQQSVFAKLKDHHHPVAVIDSKDKARNYINFLRGRLIGRHEI